MENARLTALDTERLCLSKEGGQGTPAEVLHGLSVGPSQGGLPGCRKDEHCQGALALILSDFHLQLSKGLATSTQKGRDSC